MVRGSPDGKSSSTGLIYPTMSYAISKGLYHPRCKDAHTTYFEGIRRPPEGSKYTREELDEISEQYKQEQKQNYAERQAEKYGRLEKYSLDPENRRGYGMRLQEWITILEQKNIRKKVEITEQAIEKVNRIKPKGLTEENSEYIRKVHKELLRVAQKEIP